MGLPVHLAESELFGHKKGAFTGADKASPGLFRAAHQGTLFLDEIQELPASIQPKLLRVLEQREVLPLGEVMPVPIDVRTVVATQSSLAKASLEGRFRADLHARLDGLTVTLPPLRARREDIVPLFLQQLNQNSPGPATAIEPKFAEALCIYDWPLNVRELVQLVRRLVSVNAHEPIYACGIYPSNSRFVRALRSLRPSALTSGPWSQQSAIGARRATRASSKHSLLLCVATTGALRAPLQPWVSVARARTDCYLHIQSSRWTMLAWKNSVRRGTQ